MLEKEKEFLKKFLPYLQQNVEVDVDLIAHIRKYDILPDKDVEKLGKKHERQGNSEAVRFLVKALEAQSSDCLYRLLRAFTECNKSFITEKLVKSVSKKSTDLKEELKQRVETEVFSKINRSQINVGVLSDLANNTVTKQDYEILDTQKTILEGEVHFLRAELLDAKNYLKCYQEQAELMRKSIEDENCSLRRKLEEGQDCLKRSKTQCDDLKYDNEKLSKEKRNLVWQIDEQCSKIDYQQTKIENLCRDIEKLKYELDRFENDIKQNQLRNGADQSVAADRFKEIDIKVTENGHTIKKLWEAFGPPKNPCAKIESSKNKLLLSPDDFNSTKRKRTESQRSNSRSDSSVYTDALSSVTSRQSSPYDDIDGRSQRRETDIENDNKNTAQSEQETDKPRQNKPPAALKHTESLPEIRQKQGKYKPTSKSLNAVPRNRYPNATHATRPTPYENRNIPLFPVDLGKDLECKQPRSSFNTALKRPMTTQARRTVTTTVVVEELPTVSPFVRNSYDGSTYVRRVMSSKGSIAEKMTKTYVESSNGLVLDGVSFHRSVNSRPE